MSVWCLGGQTSVTGASNSIQLTTARGIADLADAYRPSLSVPSSNGKFGHKSTGWLDRAVFGFLHRKGVVLHAAAELEDLRLIGAVGQIDRRDVFGCFLVVVPAWESPIFN